MNRRHFLILLFLISILLAPSVVHAQAWSGIISPSRAIDWTQAGIPGGPPDANWTQCGSTISAYSGTSATISNALAACAGTNKYVLLGPGTFNLSTGFSFPTGGHVVLRGSGANSTFLSIGAGAGVNCFFGTVFICVRPTDTTYTQSPGNVVNWTAGYSQGSRQITLSSVAGIVANQTLIILDQCDTGLTGAGCTGSNVDNGNFFVCEDLYNGITGCSINGPDGAAGRPHRFQSEYVMATAINGNVVTLSQPLKHPNWNSGQTPQAWIVQPIINAGIENLAIDGAPAGSSVPTGIQFFNSYQGWVSGVKLTNMYEWFINNIQVSHMLFQNNYLFHANGHPDPYGIRIQSGGDDVTQNNIIQQVRIATSYDGPESGGVVAYNFSVNQFYPSDFMFGAYWTHSAGDDFNLWEGNIGDQMQNDNLHGSHLMETKFRNFFWGWESCANGQCGSGGFPKDAGTQGMVDASNSRYTNNIANVLGTHGFHNAYQETSAAIWAVGDGNGATTPPRPTDIVVGTTMLRWANYDTVTNAVRFCGSASNSGWATACASASEVPTAAPVYPNSVPTVGDTGAGQSPIPASFYLTSKPSWFGSAAWPPIGPDVSGGNVGQCSGTLNTPGHFSGLPATTNTQCTGTSLATGWAGHVNANPAMNCYLNVMGGVPDGTGGVLPFNPSACYGGSTVSQGPSPPTNLIVVVN
jgi:hypothetical protein